MKLRLLPKFIISLGVVGVILTVAVSLFSYGTSKAYLEEMYAERVMVNSNAIASMLDVEEVKEVIAEGGDQTESYHRMVDLFNKLKKDGEVTFLSLVIPDEDSVCFYIDAMVEEMGDDPANQLPYGSDILYVDAADPNNPEDMEKYITIWEQYAQNKGIDEPLVTDNDYGYNYTGVSVILDENGKAIAEIQYILDMMEVREYLNSFLVNMLMISFAIIGVTIILYIFFVRGVVTRPLGKLAAFTQGITDSGVFENQRIQIKTGDEIESLSESFNFMLAKLEDYIQNLSTITAEKERIGAELNVAKQIQADMLPSIFPAFPDRDEFDIYASMNPAKEVGGDFYDFFMVDDNHLAFLIADVSGKGVPAALFMVITKTLIKNQVMKGHEPYAVFEEVNNQLCENNQEGMFVTAWLGILEISTGIITYVNAGHNPPMVKRKDGKFNYLQCRPGFVLAGMDGIPYQQDKIKMQEGDYIYLYTDGVTDTNNVKEELFGEDRLRDVINVYKEHNPESLLRSIKSELDQYMGEAEQFDDITMLCIEYKG